MVLATDDDSEPESSSKPIDAETTEELEPDSAWWDPELHRLLEQVVELTPEARRQYLEQHAPGPEMVELIESMIEGESEPVTLLDKGVFRTHADIRSSLQAELEITPGDRLGAFRIESLLGEGGMGRVYRAEQLEPIRRLVALKVVRQAHGAELEPRFLAERQALGRLSHPNIARLYEAGSTADGRPFVAMELVEGAPITRYCDQHRLPLEERLRLFAAVCRGAQHAHQKQILHRDLKPSNVLVTEIDGEASAKIIDFGIAKTLGRPLLEQTLTRHGGLIGTPFYMSPEALERGDSAADLDTRSDVYSLGVLLYELLAGFRPFKSPTTELPRLLREILDTPPPRPSRRVSEVALESREAVAAARSIEPSRLSPLLAGDLDWIVMKAMARDREERYASAAELADELERVLAGEPVLARPPSFGYRFGKWAFRNRLAAGLGALTALGLILATILTSMALIRAQAAEHQSRSDAQVSRQALDFVVGLFEAASPGRTRGETLDAEQLLDAGVERIRDTDLAPLPRAEILMTLARVQTHLGQYPQAIELASESLDIRSGLLAEDDPALLATIDVLANALRRAGRLEEAEPLLQRLVTAARAEGESLALADALNSFGNLLWSLKRYEAAEKAHSEALELRIQALGDSAMEVAHSHNNLGALYLTISRFRDAEPHCRRAAELLEGLVGRNHPNTAHALNNLGVVLQRLGRYSESLSTQQQVLQIRTKVLGADHPSTAATHGNLAAFLLELKRPREAEQHARRGLEICRRAYGPDHGETFKALSSLGIALRDQKRFDEAEEVLTDVLDRRRRSFGPDDLSVARSRRSLATLWRDTGRIAAARQELQSVLELERRELGEDHRYIPLNLHLLGVLEKKAGNSKQAEDLLRQAIAKFQALSSPREKSLADSQVELAEVLRLQGRDEERSALLQQALDIRRRLLPADHPDVQELLEVVR